MRLEIISRLPAAGHGGQNLHSVPLLFIHGMFHGAWCWDVHFLDYFARHGLAAYAVNLRGHGASEGGDKLRWTRIADFVDDVDTAVRQLPRPPVVIGHSLGGFVVQKYLEDHDAPAGVLLSSPPPSGMLQPALRVARRRPLVFAKTNLTLRLAPMIATPELTREAFFSPDFPEVELRRFWRMMQDESYMAFVDMVALNLPNPEKVKTPVLVLGAARDNMLLPAEIEATARAYHTKAQIIPGVAHSSMLETGWETVAERILEWLHERINNQSSNGRAS